MLFKYAFSVCTSHEYRMKLIALNSITDLEDHLYYERAEIRKKDNIRNLKKHLKTIKNNLTSLHLSSQKKMYPRDILALILFRINH